MNPSDDFVIKFVNLWFYKEPSSNETSDSWRRWTSDAIRLLQYGDDSIFSHPKIHEIIQLCKDFGIIEYEKNILQLYYEGKMRLQIELRNVFNSPEVSMAFQSLINVVGDMVSSIKKEAEKKIEEEKNLSAIPELSKRNIFRN